MNKIVLKKYKASDFEIYKILVSDDEQMKYISGKGLTENEARNKFDRILHINSKEPELGYFKVLNPDNEYIGDCKLERYKHDNSILEIGYLLKKEFWRQGFGSEICNNLLVKANKFYPQLDMIGIIDPDNKASKKLLAKFGFKSYFLGVEENRPTEKLLLKRKLV